MGGKGKNNAARSNQTSHYGIMGGLAPSTNLPQGVKRFRLRRARNKQTIPLMPVPGLDYMKEYDLLSRNPAGSGGVGLTKVLVDRSMGPCNCGGGDTSVKADEFVVGEPFRLVIDGERVTAQVASVTSNGTVLSVSYNGLLYGPGGTNKWCPKADAPVSIPSGWCDSSCADPSDCQTGGPYSDYCEPCKVPSPGGGGTLDGTYVLRAWAGTGIPAYDDLGILVGVIEFDKDKGTYKGTVYTNLDYPFFNERTAKGEPPATSFNVISGQMKTGDGGSNLMVGKDCIKLSEDVYSSTVWTVAPDQEVTIAAASAGQQAPPRRYQLYKLGTSTDFGHVPEPYNQPILWLDRDTNLHLNVSFKKDQVTQVLTYQNANHDLCGSPHSAPGGALTPGMLPNDYPCALYLIRAPLAMKVKCNLESLQGQAWYKTKLSDSERDAIKWVLTDDAAKHTSEYLSPNIAASETCQQVGQDGRHTVYTQAYTYNNSITVFVTLKLYYQGLGGHIDIALTSKDMALDSETPKILVNNAEFQATDNVTIDMGYGLFYDFSTTTPIPDRPEFSNSGFLVWKPEPDKQGIVVGSVKTDGKSSSIRLVHDTWDARAFPVKYDYDKYGYFHTEGQGLCESVYNYSPFTKTFVIAQVDDAILPASVVQMPKQYDPSPSITISGEVIDSDYDGLTVDMIFTKHQQVASTGSTIVYLEGEDSYPTLSFSGSPKAPELQKIMDSWKPNKHAAVKYTIGKCERFDGFTLGLPQEGEYSSLYDPTANRWLIKYKLTVTNPEINADGYEYKVFRFDIAYRTDEGSVAGPVTQFTIAVSPDALKNYTFVTQDSVLI